MRAILVATAALSLMAAPASADPAKVEQKSSDAAMHETCKAMMSRMADPKAPHGHGGDKGGHASRPHGKPPSKAAMEEMHKRCEERMAAAKAGK